MRVEGLGFGVYVSKTSAPNAAPAPPPGAAILSEGLQFPSKGLQFPPGAAAQTGYESDRQVGEYMGLGLGIGTGREVRAARAHTPG